MANDKNGDAMPVTLVAPTPTPVVVTDDGRAARVRLEKELMGIRAKLRWTHLTEGARNTLAIREAQVVEALK